MAVDAHVVVSEAPPAGHMTRLCFSTHRVIRPLSGLLAFQFVGEGRQAQHHFVGGRVERALSIFHIEEDTDASLHQLLE